MESIHQSRQICAVVTTTKNKTRFYLTNEGMASDIQDRAQRFNYTYDAQASADNARREIAWKGFDWRAAVMLSDGAISER